MLAIYLRKKKLKEKLFKRANELNSLATNQLSTAMNSNCSTNLIKATRNKLRAEKYYIKARML